MTWAKIDDLMPEHPKVLTLSSDAFRVHIAAICYASRNLTDGAIMDTALPGLRATDSIIRELKRAKLWERERGRGWRIHDFLDYNPSRAQVLAQRQERAEAGRRGGQAAAIARAKATAVAGTTPLASSPVPSRPVGRSTDRSVGEDIDPSPVEATMREPDASPDPSVVTDIASQSSPPTDRSPPPAVQDGDDGHPEGCTCERCFNAVQRPTFAVSEISEPTRHEIANLFAYPPTGKRMNALLSGQLEWAAGATEEHWQELLHRARNGKNQPERQPDGSIKEGWAKTTMRGILEGGKR